MMTTTTQERPLSSSSPASQTTGHVFKGCSMIAKYELMEKLGEGTFGEVWKARRHGSKEIYALKKILMHNEKEGFPITALREIKLLKSLNHENVIRLTEMAIERGLYDKKTRKRGSVFMVTPYMDHDLAGLLENPTVRLKVPHIKSYMRQLLKGTAYLHDMKILHRDMKAANLLINNQGILKIADFGLARTYEESPPQRGKPAERPNRDYTNCVVTRWYRPPELLLGERRYGPSVDMWGVGCVFAEMMRTKPLIEGRSDLDQLIRTFRLCGSPTFETMPGYEQLPGVIDDVKVNFTERYERTLERDMYDFLIKLGVAQHSANLAVDLLSKLMLLDPLKRISAVDALDHEYFTTPPLPSRPADLPTYEASHELTRRKRELRARAPRGAHQANEQENYVHDRRKRMLEGVMPSTWGGGSGMSREDSRGIRRDTGFRGGRGDSWISSRDARERDRDRERRRSKSPREKDPRDREPKEPEVKYGRR